MAQTDHLETMTPAQANQLKKEMRRLKTERDAAIQLLFEKIGGSLTGINQIVKDRADELMEEERKNEDHLIEHRSRRRKRA